MNILFLHQYYMPEGGSGNDRSRALCQYWADAGNSVRVICSTAFFPASWRQSIPHSTLSAGVYQFRDGNTEVLALDIPYSHMMSFQRRVLAFLQFYQALKRELARQPKPDILYASSTPPTVGEAARIAAKRWGIPFVFETVDVWPDVPQGMGILKNPILLNWIHRRVNRIYAEAARIVCLSPGMRDQVLSHGVDPGKVIVSYNGTDTRRFQPASEKTNEKFTVLYAGTVGKANGLDALLDVAKLLEKESALLFQVIGGGNDLQRIKKSARERDIRNVQFVPFVAKEKIGPVFQQASAGFVCFAPYAVLEANSANKFYDYLAAGLPVILNYEGWQAEILAQYQVGFSASMQQPETVAANILRLMKDPALCRQMGEHARSLAVEKFDRRELAGDLLAEMNRVLI